MASNFVIADAVEDFGGIRAVVDCMIPEYSPHTAVTVGEVGAIASVIFANPIVRYGVDQIAPHPEPIKTIAKILNIVRTQSSAVYALTEFVRPLLAYKMYEETFRLASMLVGNPDLVNASIKAGDTDTIIGIVSAVIIGLNILSRGGNFIATHISH